MPLLLLLSGCFALSIRLLSICDCVRVYYFFNGPAGSEIYTLSLHDALPISRVMTSSVCGRFQELHGDRGFRDDPAIVGGIRSEEHTSELQSLTKLVCRLLLEKKTD